MSKKETPAGPLGGWLGTAGVLFGLYIGFYLTAAWQLDQGAGWITVIVCAIVGGYVGLALEHIVAFLIMLALTVILLFARNAMWQAISDSFFS